MHTIKGLYLKRVKNKILSIMQLPPPVHGQSVMNQTIFESELINHSFNIKTIPLSFTELDNIGKASVKKFTKMMYYIFAISKELILFKPDLIYFTLSPTGFAFYRDFFYVVLIKLFQTPVLYHLHGKGIRENALNPLNKILYSFVFKNSKIILLSKLLAADLDNVIQKKDQLAFLANGIKTQAIKNRKKSMVNDPPLILFLSNIEKTKGVLVLLKAVELLIKKNIKFKLKLVGGIVPSISKKKLNNKIEPLGDFVEYLGPKYGEEKVKIMASADIFAFPTYKEAFPLVLLEAMQNGLPIVSTFEGAIPEIIDNGQNGFLVNPENPEELAEKIEILLKDRNLRIKMGGNGKKKFLKKYTAGIFEKNLEQIFDKALMDDG